MLVLIWDRDRKNAVVLLNLIHLLDLFLLRVALFRRDDLLLNFGWCCLLINRLLLRNDGFLRQLIFLPIRRLGEVTDLNGLGNYWNCVVRVDAASVFELALFLARHGWNLGLCQVGWFRGLSAHASWIVLHLVSFFD